MNKSLCLLVTPDGVSQKQMGYVEIKEALGGWLEGLSCGEGMTAYVNEDGKRLKLPMNRLATHIITQRIASVGRQLLPGDYISGNMVIAGDVDSVGNHTDLTSAQIQKISDIADEFKKRINNVSNRRQGSVAAGRGRMDRPLLR